MLRLFIADDPTFSSIDSKSLGDHKQGIREFSDGQLFTRTLPTT